MGHNEKEIVTNYSFIFSANQKEVPKQKDEYLKCTKILRAWQVAREPPSLRLTSISFARKCHFRVCCIRGCHFYGVLLIF